MTSNEQFEKLDKEYEKRKAFASSLKNVLSLFNPEKPETVSVRTFDREKLRRFLKNPASESNNKDLRKLSEYLYTVSYIYRRMVRYKANQVNCKVWSAYPVFDVSEKPDKKNILKEYNRTISIVNSMNMESQIQKLMLQYWKNGVAYGYLYGDPEKDKSFYIHVLDPDYCKVNCVSYESGVIGFLFNVTYFNGKEDLLEYYDKEFERLYNEYKKDNIAWKQLPLEKTICLKADMDNLLYSIPPMSGLLEEIISITDLQAAQDEVDGLQNYKLIWGKLDTLSRTTVADDFSVDLDLALDFMNKVNDVLPENVAYALSPLDLKTIEFKDNDASGTNFLSKAYSNLIETNGSIVLNSNKITNSTAFKMAVKVEAIDAMAVIPQINAWINFYLKSTYKIENIKVDYSDISPYFMDDEIEKYTKLAGLGLPVKTELASMINANPQKSIGMDYLERELLQIGKKRWTNPLISANTQSNSSDSGGDNHKKSEDELSDSGVETRDKDKNDK